jgi:DNA-binding response OmpR family regulator
VEDEGLILLALQDALEAVGCEVLLASTGHEALLLAGAHMPDAVVLNIRLPGDLWGPVLLGRLRALAAHPLPAIIASGIKLSDADRREYDLAGGGPPVGVYLKPYNPDDLAAEMLALLRAASRQ